MRSQQNHAYSCGAVALMCAAQELGVTTIPDLDRPRGWDGGPFVVSPRLEDALYRVTSGQAMDSYSMPHAIIVCARALGLEGEVYLPPGWLTGVLTTFFPDALHRARGSGVTVVEDDAPAALAEDERELIVVTTWGVGLHYLMRRPDGSYMDPADGQDADSFEDVNSWSKYYAKTGLSIILRRA